MIEFLMAELEPKHYFDGPEDDRNFPGRTVVEFGMTYEHIKIYVKIELIPTEENNFAVMMSFHEREYKIRDFPLDFKGEVE